MNTVASQTVEIGTIVEYESSKVYCKTENKRFWYSI